MYENRGVVIRGEIPENNEVISTISVFFEEKCVIFDFPGSNIVEGGESLRREKWTLQRCLRRLEKNSGVRTF